MLTTSGAVSPISISKPIRSSAAYSAAANYTTHNYDSATFSNYSTGTDSFRMGMVGRLSQEVRTATTTADIRRLRQEVQAGEYTPDPMAIAKRMLFFAEG